MRRIVSLEKAQDTAIFGSKAVGLGQAMRDGLPVPPGVALSGAIVEAVAAGEDHAIEEVAKWVRPLGGPLAVRSSAVDEDGAEASFAGQHLTLLNVPSWQEVSSALGDIWWSANSDSAITYRQRVGLFTRPSIAVVVQALLGPETAGVMFTKNPVTGADERVIEASWGLGEAVVAGIVGYFLVLRGQTFAGHALSHVGFAGATGAVLIGVPLAVIGLVLLFAALILSIVAQFHGAKSQRRVEPPSKPLESFEE